MHMHARLLEAALSLACSFRASDYWADQEGAVQGRVSSEVSPIPVPCHGPASTFGYRLVVTEREPSASGAHGSERSSFDEAPSSRQL